MFDTNVYVAAIRGGLSSPEFQRIHDSLPRTYLAAPVAAELRAGATTEAARRVVQQFTARAHGVGRVVTPTASAWERAGDVLGQIRGREPRFRSRVRGLWNDVLIALCARQVGAALITGDAQDFELLRRYLRFELEVLPPSTG